METGESVPVPTTGKYPNASLKGSYVYQVQGTEVATLLEPYRQYGVFTADGAGNITAQSEDAALTTGGSSFSCAASCGAYQVANDGTGVVTFNNSAFSTAFSPALGPVTLALTVTSTTKAYLMEADFFRLVEEWLRFRTQRRSPQLPAGPSCSDCIRPLPPKTKPLLLKWGGLGAARQRR